jgi:outer membrane immunogenic protein
MTIGKIIMMIKSIFAAVALVASVFTATAADLPSTKRAPVAPIFAAYNWSGFYVGLQGGYGWGRSVHRQGAASSGKIDVTGGLIGATVGYNYQINSLVIGLEGDLAYSGMSGNTLTNCAAPGCRTKMDWFGTVRGRLGYAFDRVMPYITAGAAVGDVSARVGGGLSGSETRLGWTVGGGVEAAIWNNWTAKVEYLYVDLGKFNYVSAPAISADLHAHIVRAGLNYRF